MARETLRCLMWVGLGEGSAVPWLQFPSPDHHWASKLPTGSIQGREERTFPGTWEVRKGQTLFGT